MLYEVITETLLNELYGEHPQHYVAVDCVIFGYKDGELKLLLYPRSFEPAKGNWSLLGGFIQKDESSDQAAERILKRTTGLDEIYMEQVSAFTQPDREPSARVISIAYYALIRLDDHDEEIVHRITSYNVCYTKLLRVRGIISIFTDQYPPVVKNLNL